ncbi:MAG: hypothetical protein Q8Q00_04045 [Dehalococcoidia bacterium]|nr:hypothetical protein [Dehalococcoidia bacterium]
MHVEPVEARWEVVNRHPDENFAVVLGEFRHAHRVASRVPEEHPRATVVSPRTPWTVRGALKIYKSRDCHHGKPQYQK